MAAHYGLLLVPDRHRNAFNVVMALHYNADPTTVNAVTQPANTTGQPDPNDQYPFWYGGRTYTDSELSFFQDLGNNIPSVGWPIQGNGGSVTLADAQAAAAATALTVTTQASFTTGQAQQTLAAALGVQGLQKINWDD
jgi:hypothetical protein